MLSVLMACSGSTQPTDEAGPPLPVSVTEAFDMNRVKADVDLLAHDDMAGRAPGSLH